MAAHCPGESRGLYDHGSLTFREKLNYYSILSFRPYESLLKIDRKFSGSRRAFHLHVFPDRYSIEVFINDGAQAMTATILTDSDAQGISFEADGQAVMDIAKYTLFAGE